MAMWLIHVLKSGEVGFSTDGLKAFQLKVEDKRIDVNLMDKELLKDILKVATEGKGKSLLGGLTQLKNIAEELKRDGFTIRISHKGRIVLTLGSGANPTLSQLAMGTKAIEINNLSELMRLII